MTSKFTYLKLFLLSVFLFKFFPAASQTYPVYLTEGGSVKLTLGTALQTGETAVWTKNGNPLASESDGSYTIPSGQTVGVNTYKVHLVSPNPALCKGEVLDYQVYVLPSTTVSLSASTNLYCENAEDATSQLIATATPAASLPEGVKYNFIWEGTNGGTTTDPGSWGVYGTSGDITSSIFTFNKTEIGTYGLKVKVEYIVPNDSKLKAEEDILSKMTTGTQSIVVSAKPATPTITVM